MSAETDAVHEAEAALAKMKATNVGGAVPAEPVKPSTGSTYLGHIGEPAIKGKDFK